jgi:hypothetical protein
MARAGRYMSRGKRIVPVDAYSASSFAEKRAYQLRIVGVAQEPLYACRLCPAELPIKVTERDRQGHLARSHAGQERGRTLRVLFKRVKRGER